MFARDLVTVMEEDNVGDFGTDLFVSTRGVIPVLSSGRATVQVIDTGGSGVENTHNATLRPAFLVQTAQIVARAGDYETAYAKAWAAYVSVFGIRNRFVGSGWYRSVRPLQVPFDLGLDDRKQSKVGFNVVGVYNRRD